MESHDDRLAVRARFFDHNIRDALCEVAFLICGTAGQHCDLH
jgi:hypothetical protein